MQVISALKKHYVELEDYFNVNLSPIEENILTNHTIYDLIQGIKTSMAILRSRIPFVTSDPTQENEIKRSFQVSFDEIRKRIDSVVMDANSDNNDAIQELWGGEFPLDPF